MQLQIILLVSLDCTVFYKLKKVNMNNFWNIKNTINVPLIIANEIKRSAYKIFLRFVFISLINWKNRTLWMCWSTWKKNPQLTLIHSYFKGAISFFCTIYLWTYIAIWESWHSFRNSPYVLWLSFNIASLRKGSNSFFSNCFKFELLKMNQDWTFDWIMLLCSLL